MRIRTRQKKYWNVENYVFDAQCDEWMERRGHEKTQDDSIASSTLTIGPITPRFRHGITDFDGRLTHHETNRFTADTQRGDS
jgi:hypothetical protein